MGMKRKLRLICLVSLALPCEMAKGQVDNEISLTPNAAERLVLPPVSAGEPAAGKLVLVTPPEYAGTEVYHSLYLPPGWTPGWRQTGRRLPVIFEYTGNYFPTSGSTGEVKDAGLGYGLSGGRFIWVSLPYIRADGMENEVNWWGDVEKTTQYAKTNVPRIIEEFGGDPDTVFLCGFSRGAIGVNFIGLHDDEIARLWTAFITHDHFDGVREWRKTAWGSPLEKYREEAAGRLKRVRGRPCLVCQNGGTRATEDFIRAVLPDAENFAFCDIDTRAILGEFPNETAIHPHTDRWLLAPSGYRTKVWEWMNRAMEKTQ